MRTVMQSSREGLAGLPDMIDAEEKSAMARRNCVARLALGLAMGIALAGFQLFGDVPQPDGPGEGETPPVCRLSLAPGEYAAFFEDYRTAALAGQPDMLDAGILFPPNRAGMALSIAEGYLGK